MSSYFQKKFRKLATQGTIIKLSQAASLKKAPLRVETLEEICVTELNDVNILIQITYKPEYVCVFVSYSDAHELFCTSLVIV